MKRKKNNRGFTIIEIIVCISLISIIGIGMTIIIVKNNEKKEQKILNKYETTFDNALEVYLSNHEEISNNLNTNAKAAAVTLEVLKNDGLIAEDLDIDYKNNYYLLSNAKLLSADENTSNVECDNNVVPIEVFKKWDLSEDDDGKRVIYICPNNDDSSNNTTSADTKDLEERVSKLETLLQRMNMNDKNYVIFDVESDNSQLAYFPDNEDNNEYGDYNDIWRIVENASSSNNYTLMYNQSISTNYSSLFPKVSDIEDYTKDSSNKLLVEETQTKYKYAKTYTDCENSNFITEKVYSLNAGVLGNYYSFDSDGDLGNIQGLYKIGTDYYTSAKYYSTTKCYYFTTKLDNVDAYIAQNLEYSYLKKDSPYKSYYFSNNGDDALNLVNETSGLDYISMFDLNETNPFKDALKKAINSNFINNLKESSNSYSYSLITSTNSLIGRNDNGYNSTYLRTLTKQEVDNNKSWLSTFTVPIGLYYSSGYDISELSHLNTIVTSYKYTPKELYYVYSSYGEITYKSTYVVKAYKSSTIYASGDTIGLTKLNPSYSLLNAKYNPVIDLKNATLLTNINNYSYNYKTKRSSCTNDQLGTYECPYLLKIGNYFSDGTTS